MKDHVVIILHDKTNILFIKRSSQKKDLPGLWAFPSGTVEPNELAENTVTREAEEELGVIVSIEKGLGVISLPEFKIRLLPFVCSIISGTPSIKEVTEIEEIQWMTFYNFFKTFPDCETGHVLHYLRQHPEIHTLIV